MTLLSRVLGNEEPSISRHHFMSDVAEYGRKSPPMGSNNAERRQNIIDNNAITVPEETQLDLFISSATAKVLAIRDELVAAGVSSAVAIDIGITTYSHEVHNILLKGENGTYTESEAKTRLGV